MPFWKSAGLQLRYLIGQDTDRQYYSNILLPLVNALVCCCRGHLWPSACARCGAGPRLLSIAIVRWYCGIHRQPIFQWLPLSVHLCAVQNFLYWIPLLPYSLVTGEVYPYSQPVVPPHLHRALQAGCLPLQPCAPHPIPQPLL